MERLLLFAGVAAASAALVKLLERTGREYVVLVSLASVVLAVGFAVEAAQPVVAFVAGLLQWEAVDAAWVRILLKVLGISLLCQTTAAVCRDAGENSLAFGLETLCRFTVLAQALPLLQELAGVIAGLLAE